jgi:hypothetical protein
VFGITALTAVARASGRAPSPVLSRNYRSIEAAEGMAHAVAALQLAVRDGRRASECGPLRDEFLRWLAIEHDNYTERGEPELAGVIDVGGRALFAAAEAGAPIDQIDARARIVRTDLEALVSLSKTPCSPPTVTRAASPTAWCSACSPARAGHPARAAAGWALATALARAWTPGSARRRSARRDQSIDDGLLVPIRPVWCCMNEVASAIFGLDRGEVIGKRLDDLATRQPHFLRIREAARELLARPEREGERVELTLFLRGRDHHYVRSARLPSTRATARAPGLVLALQDVTSCAPKAPPAPSWRLFSHESAAAHLASAALDLLGRSGGAPRVAARAARDGAGGRGTADDLANGSSTSRAGRRASRLRRRPVDLADVIHRATRLFALQAQEKGVGLECAAAEGLTIVGDPTKLTWTISNLLSNALRYTPAGGRVRVEAERQDGRVVVSVSDTGPGIPPEQRERIFERFAQAPESGDLGAAGLGLAIVRDIVQAHGGRIHLESRVGQGSRFSLELPTE